MTSAFNKLYKGEARVVFLFQLHVLELTISFWSRDTGTYDGAYIGSVFLTFSKGFIVYFDNSFGCSFGCITVSETLVFFQLNNIFESQN